MTTWSGTEILIFIVTMDAETSTSASHDTLLNQLEAIGIESTTSIKTLGTDTPIPRGNISNETLELLTNASASLANPKRGIKRMRETTPTGDERSTYPKDSKALYLKTKTLHRRKLSLAATIHQIKEGVSQNRYPNQANFRCGFPPNREETFKKQWNSIVKKCKEDLTCLIMQDLNSKYQNTKALIQGNLESLKGILNNTQFAEIKSFLDDRYKSAIPAAMNRANSRFQQRGRSRQRQPRPNWRSRGPANKGKIQTRPGNNKTQLKQTLTSLLEQLN